MARFATLKIATIHQPKQNPNRMSKVDQDTLDAAVLLAKERGLTSDSLTLLQPILVRVDGDGYEIIDGAHRYEAAKSAQLLTVPAVVLDCSEDDAKKLQIGMNRLRGTLNVGDVGSILSSLDLDSSSVDLALTGYAPDEVASLLRMAEAVDAADADARTFEDEDLPPRDIDPNDVADKPWSIQLTFSSKADRDKVRKALRTAAGGGRGADLGVGALRLAEG